MKRVLACILACWLSATSSAVIRTFDGDASTDWNDPVNGSNNTRPTALDRAVIPSGEVCEITSANAHADTIQIDAGGTLRIDGGSGAYHLTLENNNNNLGGGGNDHSLVEGTLEVFGHGLGADIRFEVNNHAFDGDGIFVIKAGRVEIEAGITFTNGLVTGGIRGSGTIQGDEDASTEPSVLGHFENAGLVAASGTLTLGSHTAITDTADASWTFYICGSELVFNSAATGLFGDFINPNVQSKGTIICNESVKTCGTFVRNDGGVTVGTGKSFQYVSFVAGSSATCTQNPAGSCGSPPTCLAPCVISGFNVAICGLCP